MVVDIRYQPFRNAVVTALKKSARSHWTQWPVLAVSSTSALGIRRPSIAAPLGLLTLSSRPHITSVGVASLASRGSRVKSIRHSVPSPGRPLQGWVGDDLGVDRGLVPGLDE